MISYDVCECGAPLEPMDRPTPKPKGSEVLLRVLAAGVCHTDLHLAEGFYDLGSGKRLAMSDRGVKLPLTMGHETVGEVVAVGPEARGVAVGDRRLVFPWLGCGTCPPCRRGDENLCGAPQTIGIFRPGGYADHLLVSHPRCLFDVGDLPPEQAAPLACSGLTTYGALKKLGAVVERELVVIVGAGGLGLMCLAVLKAMGGRGAIVVDIDARKRAAALEGGAVAAIDGAAPDAVQQVQAAAGGGAWGVVDLVGASSTVQLGMSALAKGGKLIVVGLFGGELPVSVALLPLRAIALQGSYVGTPSEQAELLDLVRRTGMPALPITKRPLSEVNATMSDLKAGKLVGRAVLTPAGR
jgi:D-arabinose 1-dehydrogenase-like Zn-dependent alcohol dehydrogenase